MDWILVTEDGKMNFSWRQMDLKPLLYQLIKNEVNSIVDRRQELDITTGRVSKRC
jgi:hypothetical protein